MRGFLERFAVLYVEMGGSLTFLWCFINYCLKRMDEIHTIDFLQVINILAIGIKNDSLHLERRKTV